MCEGVGVSMRVYIAVHTDISLSVMCVTACACTCGILGETSRDSEGGLWAVPIFFSIS